MVEYGFDDEDYLNEDDARKNGYTRNDIVELCEGNEKLAEDIYNIVEWECIETRLNEMDEFDEIGE